jgi:hypothetical protein
MMAYCVIIRFMWFANFNIYTITRWQLEHMIGVYFNSLKPCS